jgi:hypothetical protein
MLASGTWPNGDHLALRKFSLGIGNDDAANGHFLPIEAATDDTIVE